MRGWGLTAAMIWGAVLTVQAQTAASPTYDCVSPDGRNQIRLWVSPLAYEVSRDRVTVVKKTEIGMTVNGADLKTRAPVAVRKESRSGQLATPVYKKSSIELAAQEVQVDFGDWALRLIARDDGVAYRFETRLPGKIRVDGERADLTLPASDVHCSLNYGNRMGCEETVPLSCAASEIVTDGRQNHNRVYLPFVYSHAGKWVAVVESDTHDYPIWNFKRTSAESAAVLNSEFAPWPKTTFHTSDWHTALPEGGRWIMIRESENYLVETDGTRTFPWRAFVLTDAPAKFCEADLVYALAPEKSPMDFSWVKPGKVAWDWWNAWDNQGQEKGCNTANYRRFIDFSAQHGVEYVILDDGWSENLNIWKFHPKVDVPEIIRYGKSKGVGIVLWMAWAQIYGHEEKVAKYFSELGAKGFKVDFMDRGDADVERFLWRFAEACARHHMLIDYHGVHRPTGLSRVFPNVLNYEGVHGLEQTKWYKGNYDFVDNDVKQFFLRMTAGPMDYTPGAMDNYPIGKYAGTHSNPGSIGTRVRQMALLVAYEAPLQMLCDAPHKYELNGECLNFMARTPVVWAKTIGLGGDPDTFAAVARQAKDGAWYVAVINGSAPRKFSVNTSFLAPGPWKYELFRDAYGAETNPTSYVHLSGAELNAGAEVPLTMAPGGGLVMRIAR